MLDPVVEVLRKGGRFLVTMHRRPDGDALGSSLALACALREMGKEVVHYNPDPPPGNLAFLPGADELIRTIPFGKFDATLVCDSPRLNCLGDGLPKSEDRRGVLISIDHHNKSEEFGDLNIIDPKASAAGVIVFRLLKRMGHEISSDVATAIYVSILMDTGSFRYDSTDPESMSICGDLIELGVSPWEMASQIYETQPLSRLKLLSEALSTIEMFNGGRLAVITITIEMMKQTGASAEMLDGFVNHARAIDGVEVALMLVEQSEGLYQGSFRSRGNLRLCGLGKSLGGRGTAFGASAVLTGDIEDVKERASLAIRDLFKDADAAVA